MNHINSFNLLLAQVLKFQFKLMKIKKNHLYNLSPPSFLCQMPRINHNFFYGSPNN